MHTQSGKGQDLQCVGGASEIVAVKSEAQAGIGACSGHLTLYRVEMHQRRAQCRMGLCVGRQADTFDRGLPAFTHAGYSGRDAVGVANDAAASQMHQVCRSELCIQVWGLSSPLARRKDRHQWHQAGERREAGACRTDHRIVGLPELAADSVDMKMVNTCQAPLFLVSLEGKA